jgi:hypothetical protein
MPGRAAARRIAASSPPRSSPRRAKRREQEIHHQERSLCPGDPRAGRSSAIRRPCEDGASQPPGRGEEPKPATRAEKKEKPTVHLTHDLIERVKNAAYWNPRLTIAAIAERGIIQVIDQIERENGGPYPPRESELKGGRPIGSTSARRMPETL